MATTLLNNQSITFSTAVEEAFESIFNELLGTSNATLHVFSDDGENWTIDLSTKQNNNIIIKFFISKSNKPIIDFIIFGGNTTNTFVSTDDFNYVIKELVDIVHTYICSSSKVRRELLRKNSNFLLKA